MNETNDIGDLEDRLIVLEGIVDELKESGLLKPQLEIVIVYQLLSQYVTLEDSVLAAIDSLSSSISLDQQKQLIQHTEKYNELGCEFQDT